MIDYKLVIGLLCVMFTNIMLGSSLAKIKQEFKSGTLWNGVYKALAIIISMFLMSVMAYFNPDVLLVSINGVNLNMKSAMEIIMTGGISMYGAMCLKKIAKLIGVTTSINDVSKENKVVIPEENYIKR